MTDKIDDGGMAFPTVKSSLMRDHVREAGRFTHDYETIGGMSLRDYFAGRIAGGLASRAGSFGGQLGAGEIASRSYEIADAMLAARKTSS